MALRGEGPPVRLCISVPPQHGKTELIKHWLARLIGRYQHLRHAYCSYGAGLAHPNSAAIRDLVKRLGVELDKESEKLWTTRAGGGLSASGIPGPLTGRPVDGIAVIDDPLRGREQANSPTIRNKVWDWYTSTLFSRIHNATSIIVVATRWHEDDLTGRLTDPKREHPFELINIPAINEAGEPLCPQLHSKEQLDEARANSEADWWSLYMGKPRSDEGYLFDAPLLAPRSSFPTTGRVGIGVDLAYTEKKSADHSSAVAMMEADGMFYVIDRLSRQEKAEQFIPRLVRFVNRYPGAPVIWHGSTTEAGIAGSLGVPRLRGVIAKGDKKVRATPLATAWNHIRQVENGVVVYEDPQRVIVPSDAEWSNDYVDVVTSFTGADGMRDDDVDASASAFVALKQGKPGGLTEKQAHRQAPAENLFGGGHHRGLF